MKTITITGATGFVGKNLIFDLIKSKKYYINIITRNKLKAKKIFGNKVSYFEWNYKIQDFPEDSVQNSNIFINLMGESITSYSSQKGRKEVYDSRIKSLEKIIKKIKLNMDLFISASAIQIYKSDFKKIYTENSKLNKDLSDLQKLCIEWEDKIKKVSKRSVSLRISPVITKDSKIVKTFSKTKFLGFVLNLNYGKPNFSWIHLDDLIEIIKYTIINNKIKGPINCSANSETKFDDFINAIKNKNTIKINIPNFISKLVFGRLQDIFLIGCKVKSKKLLDSGFKFKYTKLSDVFN